MTGHGSFSDSDPFFSAKLKIEWANSNIGYLNAILKTIPADDMYRVGIKYDSNLRKYKVEFAGAEYMRAEIPLMVGDIVHNLRSALDHAATAIVGARSTVVYFPFHEKRESFVSCAKVRAIDQACPGLGQHIVSKLEPYKDGRSGLWPITKLDAIDKHKLIVTVLSVANIWCERISDDNCNSIEDVVVSVREGQVHFPFELGLEPKINGKIKPIFDIFFGHGTFFESKPVIPTLMNMLQAVSEAVGAIAQFVTEAGGIIRRDTAHKAAS